MYIYICLYSKLNSPLESHDWGHDLVTSGLSRGVGFGRPVVEPLAYETSPAFGYFTIRRRRMMRRRRRKQRDPMRNTATTPTSVRKFHWTVPYQIIVQPSKYCWLCVTLRARADGCFHVLVGSSLLFPAYQGDDCLMAMLSDEQQMQLAQPLCLSQQSPPGTLLGISC